MGTTARQTEAVSGQPFMTTEEVDTAAGILLSKDTEGTISDQDGMKNGTAIGRRIIGDLTTASDSADHGVHPYEGNSKLLQDGEMLDRTVRLDDLL